MTYKLARSFSCAHFYSQPQWDEARNRQEFGLCFNPHGHGHDYKLEIEIRTSSLEKAQSDFQFLISQLDHQHLNFSVPGFQNQIPTTENFSLYLKTQLQSLFQKHQTELLRLTLAETPEIWVEL